MMIHALHTTLTDPIRRFLVSAGIFLAPVLLVAQPPENAWPEIVWARTTLPDQNIETAGFTPDGKYVVAASRSHIVRPAEVRLFDRATGLLVWSVPTFHRAARYNSIAGLVAIAVYPDGDEVDKIEVWDMGTRQPVSKVSGEFGGILSLSLSDNGRYLAFSGWDSTLNVWDIEEHRFVRSWKLENTIGYAHLSPSGRYLFAAFWNNQQGYSDKVWMWDVETGEPTMGIFRRSFDPFSGFAFSPDERYFAMTGRFDDNPWAVSIYRVPDGIPVREYYGSENEGERFDYGFFAVTFSPDGRYIAGYNYFGHSSLLWDLETGQRIDSIYHDRNLTYSTLTAYALDGGNRSLLMGTLFGHVNTWDLHEHRLVREFLDWPYQKSSHVLQTAFSGSGKYLVAGYLYGHVRLYDSETGDEIRALPHTSRKVWSVNGLDVSPDDSLIAVGGRDSLLTLYHRSTGEPAWVSSNRGGPVWDVKFLPYGTHVAASSDRGLVFFHVASGDSVSFIPEQDTALFAFSPDGARVVMVGRGGPVRIWSTADGGLVRELGVQTAPLEVAWSGDGRHIAACGGDGSIHVWDAASGELVRSWRHEEGTAVNAVAFTPEGRYLLSGGTDATLRVWHIAGGFEAYRYRDFPVAVTTLSVSPDGKYVATASDDGSFDYRLIVRHGVGSVLSVPGQPRSPSLVADYTLHPNPSGGTVTASFELRRAAHVRLRVADILGRPIAVPLNGRIDSGKHEIAIPMGDLPVGTYLCTLEVEGRTITEVLTLQR